MVQNKDVDGHERMVSGSLVDRLRPIVQGAVSEHGLEEGNALVLFELADVISERGEAVIMLVAAIRNTVARKDDGDFELACATATTYMADLLEEIQTGELAKFRQEAYGDE